MLDQDNPEVGWERLAEVVGEAGRYRSRIVPVLGSGMRSWAGEQVLPRWFKEWEPLVAQLAQHLAITDFKHSASLTEDFERLVEAYRRLDPSVEPIVAENRIIAGHVRRLLAAEPYARFPSLGRQIKRFDTLGFSDVIDLGLDDIFSRPKEPGDVLSGRFAAGSSTVVVLGHGRRAWHPHGFVRAEHAEGQVVLGVERYGRALAAAVTAYKHHDEWLCTHPEARGQDVRDTPYEPEHWVPLALYAPLLLLGVSLGPDDWDISWFLRMRKRAQAIHGVHVPVFRLTCDTDRDYIRVRAGAESTGVRHLHGGRTWKHAWERLFGVLGAD